MVPFDCVLTALSYIWGPLVDDRVNAQETHLTTRTDTTRTTYVQETDPILWTEFATAFQDSWKDTSKKQNAHDQLCKLVIKGWDIDTYIVTFEHLALAANWALPTEGTIMQFQEGLNKMIHSHALDWDKILETFEEWKAAAHTEVAPKKNTTWALLAHANAPVRTNTMTTAPLRTNTKTPLPWTLSMSPWMSMPPLPPSSRNWPQKSMPS